MEVKNKVVNLFGLAIFVAALVYALNSVAEAIGKEDSWYVSEEWYVPLFIALNMYVMSLVFLPYSWSNTISSISGISQKEAFFYHGASLLYRYLPGNIFHYLARQAFAKKISIAQSQAVFASSLEVVGHLCVASILSCFVLYDVYDIVQNTFSLESKTTLIILCGIFLIIFLLARRYLRISKNRFDQLYQDIAANLGSVAISILANAFYFIANGLILAFVIFSISTSEGLELSVLSVVGYYSFAWLLGFISPGAPAGLGVRDVLLISFFVPDLGIEISTIIVVFFRILQIGGDILFALLLVLLRFSRII